MGTGSARAGIPPERFTIVPGAVDADRFRFRPPKNNGQGRAARIAPPTLLYHGRVDRRKGALDLLAAVATMHTDVRVVMSGIGPDF